MYGNGNRFRAMCPRKRGYYTLLAKKIYISGQPRKSFYRKTLNNLRNIFLAAAFGEPIIRHCTWMHILICNKLQ